MTSAYSGARSDSASISPSFDCGPRPDQFSRRLHELLLVLHGRELERSRIRDEETECTTCTSRSGDSSDSGFEYSGNDEQSVLTKIRTSNPPSRVVTRSPTVFAHICAKTQFLINNPHIGTFYPVLVHLSVMLQTVRDPATNPYNKISTTSMMISLPLVLEFPVAELFSALIRQKIVSFFFLTHIYIRILQTQT